MTRTWSPTVVLIGVILVFSACTTSGTYIANPYAAWKNDTLPPASDLAYQVFLIGDTGGASLDPLEPALRLLKRQLAQAGDNAAVVFLGDNIYCCGLADSGTVRRPRDEARLRAQLSAVDDFKGRIVFLPGNHDWNHDEPGGRDAVARQERFVEAYLNRGNTFLPDDGFPGPTAVSLTDRLTLIVLDTEWWLYRYEKSFGDTGEYDLEEDANFLIELNDLIERNDDNDVLVVGHHPLFSNGTHAGILPLRDHLFPLRQIHPALTIPLPILGSIYPLYVRFNGGLQNLYHPRYKALRTALLQILRQHEKLVYAAGHDHTLQYHPINLPPKNFPFHHIVSGAGSRPSPVGRGRGAAFASGQREGYSVLNYYRDGATWMEMWGAGDEGATGTLLFRTELQGPARELIDPQVPPGAAVDYRDSTVTRAVNPAYKAGALKKLFLGSHNRRAWTTPVTVPVFDLDHTFGGLTIGKRGGGQQTFSLRLADGEEHEYVLRSIDKDPSKTVPVNLQGTIATDIVQDQTASIHPFGAFIIPPLADAAGVYHTTPRLFYVPDDPRLGIYRDLFGGNVMMLEERPNDDMSYAEHFGRSTDVVSANKFYREITDDNDHRVDHRAFARVRLFDMLLADWDRHSDQWRWSSFEPYELNPALEGEARTQGKIYRPIPRDRDWAFNKLNGLLPTLVSIFVDRKFQDFTESYGHLPGLNGNGLRQDRHLLSPLERQDWIEIADSIRTALTDAVIEDAVRRWPAPIYALDGEETIRLLKTRRDQLTDVAEAFYTLHARVVDVVGSNKHERFEVTRLNDDATRVVVYKTSKEGEKRRVLYERTLLEAETDDIRLYGLDGNDTFVIDGEVGEGIRVIAVGGAGHDTFIDHSQVRGGSKKTRFYDTETGNTWDVRNETKMTRSDDDPAVNYYDPYEYAYDTALPVLFLGNNKDDGLFVGGGVNITRHGFRKKPYAATHQIKANFAAKTLAFNVVYEGDYVDIAGRWDGRLNAEYHSPNTIRNFYGLGNETENTERNRRFYQARLTQLRVAPSLAKDLEQGAEIRLGPFLEITQVGEDANRFLAIQPGISENTFEDQWVAGAEAEVSIDTRDRPVNPSLGFNWTSRAALHAGIRNNTDTYGTLSSDLSFFLSLSLSPQVTLAVRLGTAHNIGDFPFYGANTLGGRDNLRGFRSTRYTGRTSFYQNVDLRLELFKFSTYLAIGKAGLLGFFDHGRVWTEADDGRGVSQAFLKGYHPGYGGGAWFEIFNQFVLNAYLGFSEDDRTFTLQTGFQF